MLDWTTVLAQAVNFLVLVLILRRFLFRPILEAAEKRRRTIAARLDGASRAETEARELADGLEQSRQRLEQERSDVLEQARAEADEILRRDLDKARSEVEAKRTLWLNSLKAEQGALAREAAEVVGRQSIEVARKALADLAGDDIQDRLALALAARADEAARELAPDGIDDTNEIVAVASSSPLSPKARKVLELALKAALPGTRAEFTIAEDGPGLILSAGGRRLSWTVDRYLSDLEHEIRAVLARHRSKQ